MHAATDNLAFAPPPEPGAVRGFTAAVIAHLLLMAALTWGINWNKDETPVAVQAELWSSVPEQAAPAPAPPPPPPPPPAPVVAPPVAPPPVVQAPPPAPPPAARAPDISIEREKQRKREEAQRVQRELEERRKLEAQKQLEARKELEARKQLDAQKKLEAQKRKQLQEEAERAERKQREEQLKLAKEQAQEKEKARERDRAKREQASKQQLEAERKKNLDRMLASAQGTGAPNSAGTAARTRGPSGSYAGRIAARIKPNIVFSDVASGNPAAVIHLRVAPDGTIVGSKLVKSSGLKSWDDAVLRAIDKTEIIPRDTDGTVVPEFDIEFRPRD